MILPKTHSMALFLKEKGLDTRKNRSLAGITMDEIARQANSVKWKGYSHYLPTDVSNAIRNKNDILCDPEWSPGEPSAFKKEYSRNRSLDIECPRDMGLHIAKMLDSHSPEFKVKALKTAQALLEV
jgi:hypothetical protein